MKSFLPYILNFEHSKVKMYYNFFVKIQELPPEIGEALCQLIDREPEEDPTLKRCVCDRVSSAKLIRLDLVGNL